MHSAKKQKVASFYSKSLPRPTVLLDDENKPVRDRVDAPEPVTGALLGKYSQQVQLDVKKQSQHAVDRCRVGKTCPDEQGRQQAGVQRGSSSLLDSLWSHGIP